MPVPRIARIHLVYQFIILNLLIFLISYNGILPDKRFLFLTLIPIFGYQLFIVFCCTELLPLPNWFNWTETEVPSNEDQTSNNLSGVPEISTSGSTNSTEVSDIISPIIPRARLSVKSKGTPGSVTSNDANTQTAFQDVSGILKKAPVFTKASARRSESTKSYRFLQREKRFEDSFDTNENASSYKPRNWRSLQDQKSTKSQSNLRSQNFPAEETKEATSPIKLETLEESIETDSSDLSRSYSFPFRQRKLSKLIESGDNLVNDLNIPIMPAWTALDYFDASNTSRRRKSISTEAIDRELRLINLHFDQQKVKNDFTQSMEVERESIVEPATTKRGLKSSASFNKWKQGISKYFNKAKQENVKADNTRQDAEAKKPFFKELFLSKDNLYQGPEKKVVANKRNSVFFGPDNQIKLSNRSPSYISYESDYFGNE